MGMNHWTQPLNRENFDEFFHLYVPHAYRSAYRVLGDSTRTENAITEAFLEIFHKRNSEEAKNLVFFFSDVLQKRVAALAAQYPIMETNKTVPNRTIDEFTQNSILSDIHKKIDSPAFRIIEMITSNAVNKTSIKTDPILGQIQNKGITLGLIFQLLIVAILIFIITFAGAKTIFGVNDVVPNTPNAKSVPIENQIVSILNYLPLANFSNTVPVPTDAAGLPIPSPTATPTATPQIEITVQSATRG
jgi:hypothetical protein